MAAKADRALEKQLTDFDVHGFRAALLGWYRVAQRSLPWRERRDPYAILVSELMLQQTQVKTVIPYYLRFMARFPTLQALAKAPEQEVLKHWEGLGYYRRARYLQAAARQILANFQGRFPSTKPDIDALRGVGPYTSAAVASIAFGLPWACVDGNVVRVLSRLFAIDQDVSSTLTGKNIQALAQTVLDPPRAGDFNQAMMELGATVCTPRSPGCLTCPLGGFCRTRLRGDDPLKRPFKSKRVQPSKITYQSLFLFSEKQFLLAQRAPEGLMASMWELPTQAEDAFEPWGDCFVEPVQILGRHPKALTHKFTHLHATYHLSIGSSRRPVSWRQAPRAYARTQWFREGDLERLPLTKVVNKLLPDLYSYMKGTHLWPKEPSLFPGPPPTNC